MEVYKLGDGEPEYVVVGGIHGDEPCGPNAIERFIESDYEVIEPVKFVIANEEALEQNKRFLETDLNRTFPGDPDSEIHEEKLASKVLEQVKGKKLVDIHSTQSHPEPFATFSEKNDTTMDLIRCCNVKNAVLFPQEAGTLNEQVDGVIVEAGLQGTEQATENAYSTLVNFLASKGIVDEDFDTSEPRIFQYQETVEGDWTFTAENFREIKKGEKFAERNGEDLVADEDFYPVLMSTSGYEGLLGFKAKKIQG